MNKRYYYEKKDFECFIAPDVGRRLHMHNEVEFLYIYKGKLKVHCNFQEYTAKPGDFVLIFPNTIHAFDIIEKPEYLLNIFKKNIMPTMVPTFTNFTLDGGPVIPSEVLHPEVVYGMEQVYAREELQGKNTITIAYLTIAMEHIMNYIQLKPLKEDKNLEWIYQVLNYLNENYQNPIKLDDVSKELGISKYHLSRNFNIHIGCSINEYINTLRVERAKTLIETTDMQITRIALECGFDSLTTFFRAFKILGVGSPKKYRTQLGKLDIEQ